MATRINSNYRDALIQQIKDAGQELINRAETLVHPDLELITDFYICLNFRQGEFPEISCTTSVANKIYIDRFLGKEKNDAENQ